MDTRYTHPRIASIWSRNHQLALWATVETAWLGQLDETAWTDARQTPAPSPDRVADAEARTHHEFVAFLEEWTADFGSDAAQRWVHYGLTSSDVIDAATAMQLRDTHMVLASLADDLLLALRLVGEAHGSLMQVGRTHGQWAEPRILSVALDNLFWMLQRTTRRMSAAMPDLLEVDFSGPTGARSNLDGRKVHDALESLGLRRGIASTQIVARDSWVHWAQIVANLVTVCAAIADQYWHWAQSEVGEVEVHRGAGSSAMPHKRGNPHRAENVQGLARLARGLVGTLAESMIQRGDRDLAHNSVERVAFPDLAHLAATALQRTGEIVRDYQFAPERIEANLVAALAEQVDSSLHAAELVRGGMSRQDAINTTREEKE